ncbi:uncharacterized protein [Nicotiana sylvestris]|uniref:uncharacterized protein n=1 Tax=Nicotiana sylvestris TaxID=4096 RepID=UPI00388C99EF
MLEDLTRRIESGEKKIEANDKKVETYKSRVDQISGASPILKGVDSKKFIQRPFPEEAALKPIPKKFRMPDLPKYNGTSDPNEHVTTYTCAEKVNGLKDDEIESVLLKKFGETAMLADFFIQTHAGAIKVATRKSDVFKIKQRKNEMLREFVSFFQMELMELPLISDDWVVQAFTQGLNERSSVASKQLKQNLVEYSAMTWSDVHNRYQSTIRVEDDQLGATSGSVYPSRLLAKEPKSNKERYQPYTEDRRNTLRRNIPHNDRRMDQGQNPRGLINRAGFDKYTRPTEEPRLSEYNFNIDVSDIVFTISKIRDARWPKPVQSDPSQRNHNLVCEFHNTHGHRTEDCHQLREEVAQLLNKGHLKEFLIDRAKNQFREREAAKKNETNEPQHAIHMIMGGIDAPHDPMMRRTKISITREKRTHDYTREDALTFSDEDIETLSQPHNGALVSGRNGQSIFQLEDLRFHEHVLHSFPLTEFLS